MFILKKFQVTDLLWLGEIVWVCDGELLLSWAVGPHSTVRLQQVPELESYRICSNLLSYLVWWHKYLVLMDIEKEVEENPRSKPAGLG